MAGPGPPGLPPGWGHRLVLLGVLLGVPPPGEAAGTAGPPSHGERVTPQWLLGGRSRRAVSLEEQGALSKDKDPCGEAATLPGLLAPGYTETHYGADGQPVTVTPNHTEHCHYHGHVRGHGGSWVVLSACSGMRGLIVLSSNTSYYLSPLGTPEPGHHVLHRAEHLPLRGGTCGHGDGLGSTMADLAQLFQPGHRRARRDAWRTMKYMELFIVADHTLYRNQNLNLGQTKQRIVEIANYVDKSPCLQVDLGQACPGVTELEGHMETGMEDAQ
ncbi:disintegrin and metalloproteinase domain-containing protein 33 [Willisornis vidua]|uniref:Disintegrin and metalloproteinase domain-containing protein 33 n=1 Tax=Willisornis vidua TaxID=1566151 RepID=A0ABQ9DTQ1_9PASS|nr:disintegrin and metalloproteinase domain-containing protein 33 [Willisornis vidua]